MAFYFMLILHDYMHYQNYDKDGKIVANSEKYLPISLSDVLEDFK